MFFFFAVSAFLNGKENQNSDKVIKYKWAEVLKRNLQMKSQVRKKIKVELEETSTLTDCIFEL